MHGVNRTHQQLRVLFRKGSVEREMDKEFRLHLAMEEEANVRNGMSPEEARRAALVSFGGVERFKEQARDERGGRLLDDVVLDFRYAVRRLRRRPLFATVAALTLGLGMGAATAMFSVVDGVLLKDLPFKESGRLVALWQTMPRLQGIPGDDSRRDIWFPIGAPGWSAFARGYSRETIGRLLPRVTVGQARAETQVLMSEHPDTSGEARVIPRMAEERRGLAPPLALLFGATAFLLLIACGNVATLSTAEALSPPARDRDAFGAGSRRRENPAFAPCRKPRPRGSWEHGRHGVGFRRHQSPRRPGAADSTPPPGCGQERHNDRGARRTVIQPRALPHSPDDLLWYPGHSCLRQPGSSASQLVAWSCGGGRWASGWLWVRGRTG